MDVLVQKLRITHGRVSEVTTQRSATHTFRNGRIVEIRPLILWGLRGVFFEAF